MAQIDSPLEVARFNHGMRNMADPLSEYQDISRRSHEAVMRTFESGATRSSDVGKHDFEGFLSPLVIERFAEYMSQHRTQADGAVRDSDNWQKGISKVAYMKSGWRHFFDWWKAHRGHHIEYGLEETLCALMFNLMGYLHEHLKAKKANDSQQATQSNSASNAQSGPDTGYDPGR